MTPAILRRTLATVALGLGLCSVLPPRACPAGSDEDHFELDFPYLLTNPGKAGAAIRFSKGLATAGRSEDGPGFRASGDLVIPFGYHPDGHARLHLGGEKSWAIPVPISPSAPLPEGVPRPETPYIGSLQLQAGLEAALEPPPPGKDPAWDPMLHNWQASLVADQMIPYTMVDWLGWLRRGTGGARGTTPLTVEAALRHLWQRSPVDSTYLRVDLAASWGTPLFPVPMLETYAYFYPRAEVSWARGRRPFGTYALELALRSEALSAWLSTIFKSADPVVFARFREGRQAPLFQSVRGWEVGFGVRG